MSLISTPNLKLIYISYPFSGDQNNLDDAEFLLSELQSIFDAVFWAPWIPLCRYWKNIDTSLERGLLLDEHAVKMSDEFWMLVDPPSPGMARELKVALKYNLYIERFNSRSDVISLFEQSLKRESIQRRLLNGYISSKRAINGSRNH